MRKFMISAAMVTTFAASLASAPANADFNFGPVQNAGQCWKLSTNSKEFGYWSECPRPASVAAPTRHKNHHR
jgi:hypothetical protein